MAVGVIRGDAEVLGQLRSGLIQSAFKYRSESDLLKSAADSLASASDTNSHEVAVEDAMSLVRRLETVAEAFETIAGSLLPQIEKLRTLEQLTTKQR